METLLRFLNARIFLILGTLVALIALADRFQEYPRRWYENRLNAIERRLPAPPSADIARDLNARQSLKLKALHREVLQDIAAAKARGDDVDHLRAIADKALALDSPAYRSAAMEMLNKLRLVVPRAEKARPQ